MKRQLLQFTLLVILVFILFISLLYLFFKNIEEQDIKEHFEHISSFSFPKEGKIIESDCIGGFGDIFVMESLQSLKIHIKVLKRQ